MQTCISLVWLTIVGYTTFNHDQSFLGCSPDGHMWKFLNKYGDIFITCHIVLVFFQAAQAMSVFYKTPKEFGYFDPVKNNYHEMDEDSEGLKKDSKHKNETSVSFKMLKNAFGKVIKSKSQENSFISPERLID